MIVRWGLANLPATLAEVGIERPYVIAGQRWRDLDLPTCVAVGSSVAQRRSSRPRPTGSSRSAAAPRSTPPRRHRPRPELPLVSVPTTYSGAEWTTFFGVRSTDRRMVGTADGSHPTAIVYDVGLTLELPRAESGGDRDQRAGPLRRGALRPGQARKATRRAARARP